MSQDAPKTSWGLWSIVETVTTTVKQKSDEIINAYKEDLQEFSRTIVTDTSAVIKDNVDKFNTDSKATKTSSSSHTHLQARLLRIQRDPKTYNEAPTDASYEAWSSNFNVGAPENTEAITQLLTSNETVRDFHTALVPTKVLYRDFWCRYYYRMHQLEEEEKRRAAILNSANANDDEEFSWDAEDEGNVSKATKPSTEFFETSLTLEAPPELSSAPTSTSSTTPTKNHLPTTSSPTTPPSSTSTPPPSSPITSPEKQTVSAIVTAPEKELKLDSSAKQLESLIKAQQTTIIKTETEKEEKDIIDDIDEEIARKFEAQKINNENPVINEESTKSDAEDGWADWE
eukprot:Phypoly_transcript_11334.p1 GENE.Phypoly_transcript_11334~~Phypoly_transcript_11334.p1  ORF type:complete len:343 (+),score=82.05 Phypoly_transcript_11334:106-1134(+)